MPGQGSQACLCHGDFYLGNLLFTDQLLTGVDWERAKVMPAGNEVARFRMDLAQQLGRTWAGVLTIGRIVSPLQRELYRRSGGRRTGKPRTVPLLYLSDGDRLVICNVNPGVERPNPSVLNLQAEPRAQVQIGRRTTTATARLASADQLAAYWPQLATIWPAYPSFFDKGEGSESRWQPRRRSRSQSNDARQLNQDDGVFNPLAAGPAAL